MLRRQEGETGWNPFLKTRKARLIQFPQRAPFPCDGSVSVKQLKLQRLRTVLHSLAFSTYVEKIYLEYKKARTEIFPLSWLFSQVLTLIMVVMVIVMMTMFMIAAYYPI